MKKLITVVFTVLSISTFAQLPSNNPSFTISQQVGLETAEFTFKAIQTVNPLENYLIEGETYYPGGRTYFIIRLSDDIFFQDVLVKKGNYVGGFTGTIESLYLTIEPEDLDEKKSEDEQSEIKKIPLEMLGEFNCQIEGQSMMILPYRGFVNNSSFIISLGSISYLLNVSITGKKLFEQIEKELENKDGRYYKQYFLAAKYGVEANIENDRVFEWLQYAEKDDTNWEVKWLKATALGRIGKFRPAIEEANNAIMLLNRTESLDSTQKSETINEIQDYISSIEKNIK